jgi:hypothetical protein
MNITVHIERLILDGLPIAYSQRSRLKASVEVELARLLTHGALAPDLRTPGVLSRIMAGTIELQGDEEPQQLGKHIAHALYKGIGQ